MEFWQCPMENMAINADFWKGKRALLTGHTGFKGSWLTFWLSTLGAEVVGYSLTEPPSQPNHFALLNLPISSIAGDVRDVCRLTACLNAHQPDIVFHLAAQAFIRRLEYPFVIEGQPWGIAYGKPRRITRVGGRLNLVL